MDRHIELIAHRAGNSTSSVGPASVVADTVELDVHRFRGRLEVRHSKVLWPTGLLWEPWHLDRAGERPALASVLDAVPPGVGVWLDLKGFTPLLARQVVGTVAAGRHDGERCITASSRSWWVLPAARRAGYRTLRSIGSRLQLTAALRLRWPAADGHVVDEALLDQHVAATLRQRLPRLVAWGVRDVERASALVAWGVDGIIADDLGLLADLALRLEALRLERGGGGPTDGGAARSS